MIQRMNYTHGVYFNALCEKLEQQPFSKNQKELLATIIKKIKKMEAQENGYWGRPKESEVFLTALRTLRRFMRSDLNPMIVRLMRQEYQALIHPKCKVVFLVQETMCWPSLESVYHAMSEDERFEPKVVYVPFEHANASHGVNYFDEYQRMGIPVLHHSDYDFSVDGPDVVFFAKPYGGIPRQFYISEVEKVVDRAVYIPYGMEITRDLIRYGFQYYLHYRAWRHVAYGPTVKEVGTQYGYRNGENIAVWGHPRSDNYLPDRTWEIPQQWKEKIKGRKVILWCPHHTIKPGPECVSTWLKWNEDVFEAFQENNQVVMLWRPHPMLFGALVNNGYMVQSELNELLRDKQAKDNIILDQTADYRAAFFVSDAIITDGTTFSVEYLYTGKPLIITPHNMEQFYNYEDMKRALYFVHEPEDIHRFVRLVRDGKDPLSSKRMALRDKMMFIPSGKTTGQNIADHVFDEMTAEERQSAILEG